MDIRGSANPLNASTNSTAYSINTQQTSNRHSFCAQSQPQINQVLTDTLQRELQYGDPTRLRILLDFLSTIENCQIECQIRGQEIGQSGLMYYHQDTFR